MRPLRQPLASTIMCPYVHKNVQLAATCSPLNVRTVVCVGGLFVFGQLFDLLNNHCDRESTVRALFDLYRVVARDSPDSAGLKGEWTAAVFLFVDHPPDFFIKYRLLLLLVRVLLVHLIPLLEVKLSRNLRTFTDGNMEI